MRQDWGLDTHRNLQWSVYHQCLRPNRHHRMQSGSNQWAWRTYGHEWMSLEGILGSSSLLASESPWEHAWIGILYWLIDNIGSSNCNILQATNYRPICSCQFLCGNHSMGFAYAILALIKRSWMYILWLSVMLPLEDFCTCMPKKKFKFPESLSGNLALSVWISLLALIS